MSLLVWAVFIGVVGLWGAAGYLWERYEWNGGVCRGNGKSWVYFATDSQGGEGYKAGQVYTWFSWPGIRGGQ